jgi:hypothetical protein
MEPSTICPTSTHIYCLRARRNSESANNFDLITVRVTLLITTHSRNWALLEKPPIVQLLKNLPTFYGTRRFITMFPRALHWSLSWPRTIQSTPFYLSKIRFNIVHPPTSWSSQRSLSIWLSHQYPVCIPFLPHSCYMPCPSIQLLLTCGI